MDQKIDEMVVMVQEMIDNNEFDARALKMMFQAATYQGMMLERAKNNVEKPIDD